MIITIPNVLTNDEVLTCRNTLSSATWESGLATAGHLAATVKNNDQLPLEHPAGRQLGELILQALSTHPAFIAAALPARILPPRFNRYMGGGTYGNHIDNAIFALPGTAQRLRSDISVTLFLSSPADYDGGELIIEDTFGTHRIKLPAGHMVVYPSSSLHRVNPVTQGTRLASFFWVQSLIREDHRRRLLWDLDQSIQGLTLQDANAAEISRLTGVYHNLVREWSTP